MNRDNGKCQPKIVNKALVSALSTVRGYSGGIQSFGVTFLKQETKETGFKGESMHLGIWM